MAPRFCGMSRLSANHHRRAEWKEERELGDDGVSHADACMTHPRADTLRGGRAVNGDFPGAPAEVLHGVRKCGETERERAIFPRSIRLFEQVNDEVRPRWRR